jgi:hypothetical protein
VIDDSAIRAALHQKVSRRVPGTSIIQERADANRIITYDTMRLATYIYFAPTILVLTDPAVQPLRPADIERH